jgi:Subtilase family
MNTHRYMVLKATGPNAKVLGSIRGGVLGGAEAFRDVEITAEAATLGTRELNDLRKVPEVIRTAPVMPVMLVQPKADAAQAQDAPGSAWGVEAVGALTCPFTGAGVTVAVLDSGIDGSHDAFGGKTIVQKDFTGEGDGDNNGHGTHCAGTIFGGEVDGLRIGVAPGVSKALIGKVLNRQGGGNTEQILNGLLWAVQEGANVVSMSIGFDFPGYVKFLVSQGMKVEPATSQALSAYRSQTSCARTARCSRMRSWSPPQGTRARGPTMRSRPRRRPPPTASSRSARCNRCRDRGGSWALPRSRTPGPSSLRRA